MNVLVVGAGTIGRWFATSVASGEDAVAFADLEDDVARAAADAVEGPATAVYDGSPGGADSSDRTDAGGLDGSPPFDLVAIAVPLPAAADVIAEYAPLTEAAVCDVTGSMREPIDAMREHAPDAERLSVHPLFAPDHGPGTVAVVPDASGPTTNRVRERLAAAGNEVFETTAAEHDEAMETVQARAHTAVLAFALAAEEVPEEFHTPVSASLSEVVERVTGGEPRVYADIQAAFDGAEDVADAARTIAEADDEAFVDIYEELS